jgi:Carboxypeptidase regulatory-like domain
MTSPAGTGAASKAATLIGTVTDAGDKPVEGAEVSVRRPGSQRALRKSVTNADGRYSLGKLELGQEYTLRIKVGSGDQEVGSVVMTSSETVRDIHLPLGGSTVSSQTTSTSATTMSDTATTASDTDTTTTSTDTGTTTATTDTDTTSTDTTTTTTDTDTTTTSTDTGTTTTTTATATDTGTTTTTTATVEPGFAALEATLHQPEFAPEPPVNIGEAYELARLFTLSMFELADVPGSINRLYTETRPHYQVGDLTIQGMDQPDPAIRTKMQSILDRRTQLFDTEQDLQQSMRSLLDLGTATVATVNGDFKLLYREFVTLSADDSNGVDPEKVRPQDPAQAAVILNFLRALKRAILRMTQNLSVYGTHGTTPLVDKWSQLMDDSLDVLRYVAENKVVSSDADDRVAWSLLAALTDTPRSTVKAYVVNARDGGDLLQLAVLVYDTIQSGKLGANGLDNESDVFLEDLFFTAGRVVPGEALGVALKAPAASIRDNLTPLWP